MTSPARLLLGTIALVTLGLGGCAEAPPSAPAYARQAAPAGYGYRSSYAASGYGYPRASNYAQASGYPQASSYPQAQVANPSAMTCGYGQVAYASPSYAPYATSQGYASPVVYCQVGAAPQNGAPAPSPVVPASWTWSPTGYQASTPLPSVPAPTADVSSTGADVIIFTSAGCGPCKALKEKLALRNIPFRSIDADQERETYRLAQLASGGKSGVPLTDVNQGRSDVWILGDDADAVEKAYRQN